jgi:hypothetical protein
MHLPVSAVVMQSRLASKATLPNRFALRRLPANTSSTDIPSQPWDMTCLLRLQSHLHTTYLTSPSKPREPFFHLPSHTLCLHDCSPSYHNTPHTSLTHHNPYQSLAILTLTVPCFVYCVILRHMSFPSRGQPSLVSLSFFSLQVESNAAIDSIAALPVF